MHLKLLEPLRELFKDEVEGTREGTWSADLRLTVTLPRPGLAVRVLGPVTREELELLRSVDVGVHPGPEGHGLYHQIWQAFGSFFR
jgi:GMP synthase PP-ATPase subunit